MMPVLNFQLPVVSENIGILKHLKSAQSQKTTRKLSKLGNLDKNIEML